MCVWRGVGCGALQDYPHCAQRPLPQGPSTAQLALVIVILANDYLTVPRVGGGEWEDEGGLTSVGQALFEHTHRTQGA